MTTKSAALAIRKSGQKDAIAAKKEQHQRDLDMGLNSTMLKLIKGDAVICTACGATQLGPPSTCECVGGRTKPKAEDEDLCKQCLIAAAKGRSAAAKAAAQTEAVKNQGAVKSSRAKKRDGMGAIDLEAELQGDDVEITVKVEYPIGKLGMSMEGNSVTAVTGAPASELGVRKGWVLHSVEDQVAPTSKAELGAMIMGIFKESKAGCVIFAFRTPIVDGLLPDPKHTRTKLEACAREDVTNPARERSADRQGAKGNAADTCQRGTEQF